MPINENDYVGFGIDPVTGKRHEINHLPAIDEWEPGIYQHEQGDKIIGGIDGIANLPLQQLANRTEYLKGKVENAGGVLTLPIVIPTTGWVRDDADASGYPWHVDIPNDEIRADMTPFLTVSLAHLNAASAAAIAPTTQTMDKALRVFARFVPESAISATLALCGAASSIPVPTPGHSGVYTIPVTIPATGWTRDETITSGYPWYIDIANNDISADMTPLLMIHSNSQAVARAAGLDPSVQTQADALRVFAASQPTEDISATLALFGVAGDISTLPIATEDTLGVMKIGAGLTGSADGTVSVNRETVLTGHDLLDEDETEQDLKDILVGEDETADAGAGSGSVSGDGPDLDEASE